MKILNENLKPFGLSLSNTILDVYNLSLHPINGKMTVPTKIKTPGGMPMTLSQEKEYRKKYSPDWNKTVSEWVAELERYINKTDIDYSVISKTAYNNFKTGLNPKLTSFEELFFYQRPGNGTKEMRGHIERCLCSVAYGVELAKFIPELRRGLNIAQASKTPKKNNKVAAPTIALFCKAINQAGIDKKQDQESAEKYCKRICKKFELPYSENVRKNLYTSPTKWNATKVQENILPALPDSISEKIITYLRASITIYN